MIQDQNGVQADGEEEPPATALTTGEEPAGQEMAVDAPSSAPGYGQAISHCVGFSASNYISLCLFVTIPLLLIFFCLGYI